MSLNFNNKRFFFYLSFSFLIYIFCLWEKQIFIDGSFKKDKLSHAQCLSFYYNYWSQCTTLFRKVYRNIWSLRPVRALDNSCFARFRYTFLNKVVHEFYKNRKIWTYLICFDTQLYDLRWKLYLSFFIRLLKNKTYKILNSFLRY